MKEIRARLAAILASMLITWLATKIEVSEELTKQINDWIGIGMEIVFVTGYAVLHPIFKRMFQGRKVVTGEPKKGVV